jgi:catechol 2,3-dioxygenase-like lactoylglutathione lyase family enzyme
VINALTITGLHVLDQDEALDFYVNKLGLEVASDADLGFMRWLTVRVPGDPTREVMLELPGAPQMDPATAEQARELVSKGAAAGWLIFAVDDVYETHRELRARGVRIDEEPEDRCYAVDFWFHDPFGNQIRIGNRAAGSGDI